MLSAGLLTAMQYKHDSATHLGLLPRSYILAGSAAHIRQVSDNPALHRPGDHPDRRGRLLVFRGAGD